MSKEYLEPSDEEMLNITITVKRNSYWISPYYWWNIRTYKMNKDTCISLRNSLCKYDFRKGYVQVLDIYDAKNKILKIPIGYGLDEITNHLAYIKKTTRMEGDETEWYIEQIPRNIKYIDESNVFVEPIKVKFNMKVDIRDDFQRDAISFLLNIPKPHKFLSLATGYGKTFCAVYAVCQRQTPAIVISANLSEQWVERIQQYTDIPKDRIANLRGMRALNNIIDGKKNKNIPFYIVSTTTLNNFINAGGDLDYLLTKMGIGIKIFDEAHSFYSQNAKIDTNSNTKETFYLTATPLRSDTDEKKIFERIYKHIPIHGINTHYLAKHYIIRSINYNTNPSSADVVSCLKTHKKFFSAIAYSHYIFAQNVRSVFFMGMLKKLIDELFDKEKDMKLVVILPVLEHISIFESFLNRFPKKYNVAQYTSAVDIKDRENNLNADVILGTLKSFQEGRDVPGLKAILCAQSFSSTLIAQQLLGRLRPIKDANTYYYDFCDIGFVKMKEQRNWRKKEFISRSNLIQSRDIGHDEIANYLEELIK